MRQQNIPPVEEVLPFDLASGLVKAVGRLTVTGQPSDTNTIVIDG